MTFPLSGTSNAVQAALGASAAQFAAAVSTPVLASNYPLSLQHGALEANWQDAGLFNIQNTIWIQTNSSYRI